MSSHTTPPRLPHEFASLEPLIELLAHRIADILTTRNLAPPVADDSSPWMLIDTTAAYLGCSKHRLYKLTASGAIPHHKQEGRLFFHRAELDQWMTGRAQGHRP